MRLTRNQLRRIILQEIRSLNETSVPSYTKKFNPGELHVPEWLYKQMGIGGETWRQENPQFRPAWRTEPMIREMVVHYDDRENIIAVDITGTAQTMGEKFAWNGTLHTRYLSQQDMDSLKQLIKQGNLD